MLEWVSCNGASTLPGVNREHQPMTEIRTGDEARTGLDIEKSVAPPFETFRSRSRKK